MADLKTPEIKESPPISKLSNSVSRKKSNITCEDSVSSVETQKNSEDLHPASFYKDMDLNEILDILYKKYPFISSKCGPVMKSFLDDLISTRLQKVNLLDTSNISNQYLDCSSPEFRSEKCFKFEYNSSEEEDHVTSSISSRDTAYHNQNNFFCKLLKRLIGRFPALPGVSGEV